MSPARNHDLCEYCGGSGEADRLYTSVSTVPETGDGEGISDLSMDLCDGCGGSGRLRAGDHTPVVLPIEAGKKKLWICHPSGNLSCLTIPEDVEICVECGPELMHEREYVIHRQCVRCLRSDGDSIMRH